MAVVDTSLLVPLFDAGHPDHARALKLLSGSRRIAVVAPCLAEFTTALRRRANSVGQPGSQHARRALEALRALPGFRDAGDGLAGAAAARYGASPALSLADCWAIEAALADDDELLTFDASQAKAWQAARRAKPARS